VAHAGDDAGYLSEIDPRTGAEGSTDPSARAFRTGRPVLVGDLLSDRGPEPWRSAAATRGFASLAAVPLVADGATLGVLTIYAADAQAFDDDEMELLRELADDLAFGIVALRGRVERERLTAQLMQADRMVATGTLAAGVAHEINNPLAYLIAALDFLEEELRGIGRELPAERLEEASQALAEAREGAGRVRHIVRDLRTFSRADDERQGPVDLRRVIESSINIAYNEIKHRARLVKDYGKTPPVLANEARLGQVFLNLLVNAAQAIPEGRAGENEIRVVTRIDDAGAVVVEVRDTGTGIAPEILGRIFDPFFTTKPLGVGTGLGLSICRNIVVALGGEIGVESRLGRGTVFRLRLPPAPAQTEEERPQPALAMGRRGRVLVVDDEPVVGKAVRRVLGPEHEVVVLTSAREAREKLAQGERFDAIICDLMMPEVTGMDLHAELTALAPDQAARMILLTGGAFTPRARQFLDQVPNPRVEKPFDSANLRAVVRGLVR
jgi:signal transduction histidine kinase